MYFKKGKRGYYVLQERLSWVQTSKRSKSTVRPSASLRPFPSLSTSTIQLIHHRPSPLSLHAPHAFRNSLIEETKSTTHKTKKKKSSDAYDEKKTRRYAGMEPASTRTRTSFHKTSRPIDFRTTKGTRENQKEHKLKSDGPAHAYLYTLDLHHSDS